MRARPSTFLSTSSPADRHRPGSEASFHDGRRKRRSNRRGPDHEQVQDHSVPALLPLLVRSGPGLCLSLRPDRPGRHGPHERAIAEQLPLRARDGRARALHPGDGNSGRTDGGAGRSKLMPSGGKRASSGAGLLRHAVPAVRHRLLPTLFLPTPVGGHARVRHRARAAPGPSAVIVWHALFLPGAVPPELGLASAAQRGHTVRPHPGRRSDGTGRDAPKKQDRGFAARPCSGPAGARSFLASPRRRLPPCCPSCMARGNRVRAPCFSAAGAPGQSTMATCGACNHLP